METADVNFRGRLRQNSFDSLSELIGFLNRRLYSPIDFSGDSAEPGDWIERNEGWMNRINQASIKISSLPLVNRKARVGDLVYLTKLREKEILVVSDNSSSIQVVVLNSEKRCRKYASDTVAVISFQD